MKVYTKKGDGGETSLLGGTRVPKYDLRIEAYGTIDELNAYLGLLQDQNAALEFRPLLEVIQNKLFTMGSILASDVEKSHFKLPEIRQDDVQLLEKSIDNMEESLEPLKNFVLPGGHPANSIAHMARCICRRAERRVVEVHHTQPVPDLVLQYLNRLSDWLFVFSRFMSHTSRTAERIWTP